MRIFAALAVMLVSVSAFAAEPSASLIFPFVEGKDYVLIENPVPPTDRTKIEVVEVFAYTCPHCFHFEPILEAWMKTQQSDVNLVQMHAMWSPAMEPYQRGFYTALALKIKDKVQMPVFNAVHVDHKELGDAQAWAEFLSAYGVSKALVSSTYGSAAVTNQIKLADEHFKSYQISGTPELVIDGKYRVSTRLAGGHEEMLRVTQYLVNRVRSERALAKH